MANVPHSSDPDPFLAMIDLRVAALQQLRASYLAAKAAGAIGQSSDMLLALADARPATPADPAVPVPRRGARTVTISSQVERLLTEAARPMKMRDIAAALRRAGVGSAAAKIDPTIHSILHRLKHRGRTRRSPEGWVAIRTGAGAAIAETPAAPATTSTGPSTPAPIAPAPRAPEPAATRPAVVRVPPHRPRRAPRPRLAAGEPKPDQQPGGLAWRIESLLRSHGKPVAARYVAEATGEPLNVVGLALGRMVQQQRVEKQPDGQFAVVLHAAADATPNGA